MMVIYEGQNPDASNLVISKHLPGPRSKRKRARPRKPVYCVCQNRHAWPFTDSPCYSLSFEQTNSLAPSTPLTGRRYLKDKDPSTTPVSTATQSVSKLQTLLLGRKALPSDDLLDILR